MSGGIFQEYGSTVRLLQLQQKYDGHMSPERHPRLQGLESVVVKTKVHPAPCEVHATVYFKQARCVLEPARIYLFEETQKQDSTQVQHDQSVVKLANFLTD